MRVPADGIDECRLIAPATFNFDEAIQITASASLGDPPFTWTSDQQPPAQEGGMISRSGHPNRPFRKVFEICVDDHDHPVKWCIQTIPRLAPVRKRLLDEIVPLLTELIWQNSDAEFAVNYRETKDSLSVSNTENSFNLRCKKKRNYPDDAILSRKRLKTSINPLQLAVSKSFKSRYEDSRDKSDTGQEKETLELNNRQQVDDYYRRTLDIIGQTYLKDIMKAWIKLREPSKHVTYPYNGKPNRSDDPENPGRDSAPRWWCTQENWKEGTGCRHQGPDHLTKQERLFFSPLLLRQTGSKFGFTVERLRDSTKGLEMHEDSFKLLNELYDVREVEQRYHECDAGGENKIWVSKTTSSMSGKRKRKLKGRSDIKQEYDDASMSWSPAELLTATVTTPTESSARQAYPLFNLDFSPTTKIEYEPQNTGNPSALQAPISKCDVTCIKDNTIDSMMQSTSAGLGAIDNPYSQVRCDDWSRTRRDRVSHIEAATSSEHVSWPMNLFLRDVPVPVQRPVLVQQCELPPYTQRWPPPTDQYDYQDFLLRERFRMPHISLGMPLSGLENSIDAANNHDHGLLPYMMQQPLCASCHRPNDHTHGWRPEDRQQEQQDQPNWNTNYDNFHCSGS